MKTIKRHDLTELGSVLIMLAPLSMLILVLATVSMTVATATNARDRMSTAMATVESRTPMASDAASLYPLEVVQGATSPVAPGDGVKMKDTPVTEADITVNNGAIHVEDGLTLALPYLPW